MKTNITNGIYRAAAILMLLCASVVANKAFADGEVLNTKLEREGDYMNALIELDLEELSVSTNKAVVLTPMIVNGNRSTSLRSVTVYGRTRWYQLRRGNEAPLGGEDEMSLRKSDTRDEPVVIDESIPYKDWMNGAELILKIKWYGCRNCNEEEETIYELAQYSESTAPSQPVYAEETVQPAPKIEIVEAVAQTSKTRELNGRAYIDFPINQTYIDPYYRNNPMELAKIKATIDSIRNDRDITVRSIHISGTASPDGAYENNLRLARGRTQALMQYVQNLYNFPPGFITTSYQAVDWEGLREWLRNNYLENKESILNIINGRRLSDYQKNQNIKQYYPQQYQYLLANVYPSLRHSDYRIEYEVRQFEDVAEIAEIFKVAPDKLSLNEFYILANSYPQGSDNYNEVVETAVRIYPDDPVANLNAANAAMIWGNLYKAEQYLMKAGHSAEAERARETLARLQAQRR